MEDLLQDKRDKNNHCTDTRHCPCRSLIKISRRARLSLVTGHTNSHTPTHSDEDRKDPFCQFSKKQQIWVQKISASVENRGPFLGGSDFAASSCIQEEEEEGIEYISLSINPINSRRKHQVVVCKIFIRWESLWIVYHKTPVVVSDNSPFIGPFKHNNFFSFLYLIFFTFSVEVFCFLDRVLWLSVKKKKSKAKTEGGEGGARFRGGLTTSVILYSYTNLKSNFVIDYYRIFCNSRTSI